MTAAPREQLLRFAEDRRLFGVLSLPEQLDPARPAVLIPNTGLEHRIGPNRLHVEIARRLAQAGYATLRMDLSGMGDSRLRGDLRAHDSVADQRAALDQLQNMGIARQFVAIGLCSGGNDVHLLAREEPRLVAAAFIDHYVYPTPRFVLTYLAQRLFSLRRIGNYLQRKLETGDGKEQAFSADDIDYFRQPERKAFAADLQSFNERGLAMFFLFTGELQNLYNYREQMSDAFPLLKGNPLAELHHFPHADHTFSRSSTRGELIDALQRWLASCPPIGTSHSLPHSSPAQTGR